MILTEFSMTLTEFCKALPMKLSYRLLRRYNSDHLAYDIEVGRAVHNNDANSVSRDAQYADLYMAALQGYCEAIGRHREIIHDKLTEKGETALHIAALRGQQRFVEELVQVLRPADLETGNNQENIALCYAAAAGDINIASVMLSKNPALPNTARGVKPIYLAALLRQKDMVEYLFGRTTIREWSEEEQNELLTACIENGFYGDTARKLLASRHELALSKNFQALHALARNFPVFVQMDQSGLWRSMIKSVLGMNLPTKEELVRKDAIKLLEEILLYVRQENYFESFKRNAEIPNILFKAAETGNTDVLIHLLKLNPDLMWKEHDEKGTIFHIAVEHRRESIFKLLYELGTIKDFLARTTTTKGKNNLLHMAAAKAPPHMLNNVSGAALQMQREIIWFKEVENILPSSYRYQKNSCGKTPQFLFTENHRDLRDKGEKWMKHTATQTMFIAGLIATVTFAAVFTVPGGYDDSSNSPGKPLLLGETLFEVFTVSEAIALFSSSTSILMFLSILTSRYGENDFLKSLPDRLIIGFTALFLSLVAMTVSFCASFLLYFKHSNSIVNILLCIFAFVPLLYVHLIYPLLADLISSTYHYQSRFQPSHQLIQKQPLCRKRTNFLLHSD